MPDTRLSGGRFALARSWLWRIFETRGWGDQPHIISISPYVRERLAGRARGRIHDVENPMAEIFFSVERREEEGTVFSAGLIERRKNTLALVQAAARLRAQGVASRLRLAGPCARRTTVARSPLPWPRAGWATVSISWDPCRAKASGTSSRGRRSSLSCR